MVITIDHEIRIELIEEKHIQPIFEMVDGNRNHLRQWLPFVDKMQTVEFAQNFVKETQQRNQEGNEFAFVIIDNETFVGRIGVYKIDNKNKIGEIGYWIIQDSQGKGIATKCCKQLIEFCFRELRLNRIEIKCGTGNLKSATIPQRLNFTKEGIMRQAELLYDEFIDLNLFSLLNNDEKIK
jgi:ribosomal-protein-serine acetyltransferase